MKTITAEVDPIIAAFTFALPALGSVTITHNRQMKAAGVFVVENESGVQLNSSKVAVAQPDFNQITFTNLTTTSYSAVRADVSWQTFTAGGCNQFRVDATGDMVRINDVPYQWPAPGAVAAGTVLTNNGAGTLSWSPGGGGGPAIWQDVAGTVSLVAGPQPLNLNVSELQVTGAPGAAGQVLTSQGAGAAPTWTTPASGTIGGTIAANEVAFGTGVDSIGGDSRLTWNPGTGVFEVTDVASLPFVTADSVALTLTVANGALPTTNTLSSSGATVSDGAVAAVTVGVAPGVATVDSTALGAGALNLAVGELQVNGAPGAAGEVLTSNGPGLAPTWQAGGGGGIAIGDAVGGSTATNVLYVDGANNLANTSNLAISGSTTTFSGTLRSDPLTSSSVFMYGTNALCYFVNTGNTDGAIINLTPTGDLQVQRRNTSDFVALFLDTDTGNFSVGTNTAATSRFNVGSGDQFQVDDNGNLIKVRNVNYSFPAAQGAASTVLSNDGAGNLSWATAALAPSANSVASAAAVTIPQSTLVTVTGSTTITLFSTVGWTAGAHVTLLFSGAPLVTHSAAPAGTKLAGSVDFQAAADSILGLVFDGTNWQETFRKVA